MRLDKLLDNIYMGDIKSPFEQMDISSISCDSRKITTGSVFVALKGSAYNGEDFINEAICKGALVIVTGQDSRRVQTGNTNICFLAVHDSEEFLHKIVERYYGNPSDTVKTIGITGTNGKTTIAYLIEAIFNAHKQMCGIIGTVNCRLGNSITKATQTTPNFVDNQQFLANLAKAKVPYCVMEVSSHALTQDRVHGINFSTAVFSNLTSDHLDYHKTKKNYFSSKARLFTTLDSLSTAVINGDDCYGQQLCSMTNAKIITYGIEQQADVMAKNIQTTISGSCFTLTSPEGEIVVQTKLIGLYNVYNILASVACGLAEKINLDTIKKGIECLGNIPGRLERVDCGRDFTVFIDYAHTQDALENVLTAIHQVSQGQIILVFGCGGNRDQSKRRQMGQTASRLADLSIVTSDNPRSENPQSIIDQIITGFQRDSYKVVVNRREAIELALRLAQKGDIVLITGKGHETYQVLEDRRIDFNERDIIKKCLSC